MCTESQRTEFGQGRGQTDERTLHTSPSRRERCAQSHRGQSSVREEVKQMSGRFTRVLRDGNGVHRVIEDRVRSGKRSNR